MKHTLMILIFLLGLFAAQEQVGAVSKIDVVLRWAPLIYQQDNGRNPIARENVFTVVNFDRDWRSNNNSLNLPYYSPNMAAYYSLVESDKHYYIGYYLYYPRHAGTSPYEHDMVGTMAAVRKNPKGSEQLDTLLTYSHKQWLKWDGSQIQLINGRPVLSVSAGSHKILAIQSTERMTSISRVYPMIPEVLGHTTSCLDGYTASYAGYRLVDLNELWQRRKDIGQGNTFNRWGYFDSYDHLNAAAPWVWEYKQFGWLAQPAELMQLVRGTPIKLETYLANPYF